MNWTGVILWGFVATVFLTGIVSAAQGLRLVEFSNASLGCQNEGDATHPSTEALWDAVLDRGADAWVRRGVVNGYLATPRGLAFHIAGHELHHHRVMAERYVPLAQGRSWWAADLQSGSGATT